MSNSNDENGLDKTMSHLDNVSNENDIMSDFVSPKKKNNVKFIIVAIIFVMIICVIVYCYRIQYVHNEDYKYLVDNNESIIQQQNTNNSNERFYNKEIVFGNWGDEPIEWIVIDVDSKNQKALLLSKYVIDSKCYNEIPTSCTWETCSLRKWLNDTFYNGAFSRIEKKKILSTNVKNTNNLQYNTNGGNMTKDKIFLLSDDETEKYLIGHPELATKGTDFAKKIVIRGEKLFVNKNGNSRYWLRSPGNYSFFASNVDNDRTVDYDGNLVSNYGYGVRPAMWIKIKK